MLASPLPSFPSLVLFYTTSERKLGTVVMGAWEQGCIVTYYVIMKSFSTFVHELVYIYMSMVPRLPVLEHVYSTVPWLQSWNIHRCMVNLASFSCSPYTKLTGMGLGMRLWPQLMHIFWFRCQFTTLHQWEKVGGGMG